MEKYEGLDLEIIKFECTDVITSPSDIETPPLP